jgi:hypothetical protein
VPDQGGLLATLPADARARFDAFTAALERIDVGAMSLYAIPADDAEMEQAREAARAVAGELGLGPALEAARQEVLAFVAQDYRETSAGLGYLGGTSPTVGFGADDDRLRVMQSLADAVVAVVLDDALDADDRAELIGGWDGLLADDAGDAGDSEEADDADDA